MIGLRYLAVMDLREDTGTTQHAAGIGFFFLI